MSATTKATNETSAAAAETAPARTSGGPLVPVLSAHDIKSWPNFDVGGRARYLSLSAALKVEYRTDAHFCAYSVPAKPRRLSSGAVRKPEARAEMGDGVPMVAVVFDVDFPAAHAGDSAAGEIDVWWSEEVEKIGALLAAHPGGYVYRTRGGYRVVYVLADPFVLSTPDDERAWSARYCAWIEYLRRVFGIHADPSCKDWTRLYRLPHATRDNGPHPERRETIGDVDSIGAWVCTPSAEDEAVARASNPARVAPPRSDLPAMVAPDESVLVKLFAARGWLGDAAKGGWLAICDNADAHTKGEEFDGSTILYPASPGKAVGWVHCLHAHCVGRKPSDVLRSFTPAERDAASPPKTQDTNAPHEADDGWCPDEPGPDATTHGGTPQPPPASVTGGTSQPVRDQHFALTDDGNALRFFAAYGDVVRHSASLGWLAWDGRRWAPDAEKQVIEHAKVVARRIIRGADEITDSKTRDEVKKWWARSCSSGGIESIVRLAKSIRELDARPEDFDRDPYLFNVENGTIDLRTGELRPHDRREMLTKIAPVVFDPAATCPTWDAFLAQVQPDPDDRAFLQRRAGYALLGRANEHTFDVDYGTGCNGKSTFYEALAFVMGDYAYSMSVSTLVDRRDRAGASPDIVPLVGCRLARAVEPTQDVTLNMGTIKALAGGDAITARPLYKAPFTFHPTFKVWLCTNHKPKIPGDSAGEWRRVFLTGWNVTVRTPDKGLPDRLKAEAPGILAWAVRGALDYQAGGLRPPESVLAATAAYRREQDRFEGFLSDECNRAVNFFASSGDLAAAYRRWAEENDAPEMSATALGRELTKKGMTKAKPGGVRGYYGLSLKQKSVEAGAA